MEQPNNNNKKSKSWIYRLTHLTIRKPTNGIDNQQSTLRTDNEDTSYLRSRNSFRKSLKKMHTRMKNCVYRNTTNRSAADLQNHRINLGTAVERSENIYSLDPVRTQDCYVLIEDISSPSIMEHPAVSISNIMPIARDLQQLSPIARVPTEEIASLANCCWYWGPLTRTEAEDRLRGTKDGSFLIRDSSSTSYLFSITFRSVGKTLHSRIEYISGRYSLFDKETDGTITELIERAIKISENGIYCYSKNRDDNNPNFPIRLLYPLSRYTSVRSLKYLCRFVIRQCTNINDIPNLPLPSLVKNYLQQEGPYF